MKSRKKKQIKNNVTKKNVTEKITLKSSFEDQILAPFQKIFNEAINNPTSKFTKMRERALFRIFKDATNPLLKDDFYTYVNNLWVKQVRITDEQSYIVEVDDFRLVQFKVYKQLNGIIKSIISEKKNKEAPYIKKFYNSCITLIDSNVCKDYAKKELEIIDNFRKDPKNLWKLLGYMNRCDMYAESCPIRWEVSQDLKNVKKMQSYLSAPTFSLPYTNLYFDDGTEVEYKKRSKRHFIHYLNNIFECCFGKNHSFNVGDVYDIEVKLLQNFICPGVNKETVGYNKVYKKEAIKQYNLNWDELSKNIGFSKTPEFFITPSLSYIKCTTKILLDEWNSEQWRTYWIYIYIKQLSRFSKIGRDLYGDFYAKTVQKAKQIISTELGAAIITTYAFNNIVTENYVKYYSKPHNISYTKILAQELKLVFTKIVESCKWLQPKTKQYALLKLKHFKFYIGETEENLPDLLLDYKENDVWYNLTTLAKYRLKIFIDLNDKSLSQNIPILVWSSTPLAFYNLQPYIVNASYTPSKNAITIPISYMQEPFLSLATSHSFSYNLAHIGFTIGHEMSHALDDWGSQYDYNGNLNDWWTPKDKKIFKNIQNDIIKQYEDWAKRDGIIYDASKTIGEDMADISGLTTVIQYFVDYLSVEKQFAPIIDISLKSLFIFFAFQMRQYESKRASLYQLEHNVHPPNKYRTNVPLSRTPAFREIYQINKNDDMYWNSTNRVWLT